jgi:hypothetical protein
MEQISMTDIHVRLIRMYVMKFGLHKQTYSFTTSL